jgi:hypothetical protein
MGGNEWGKEGRRAEMLCYSVGLAAAVDFVVTTLGRIGGGRGGKSGIFGQRRKQRRLIAARLWLCPKNPNRHHPPTIIHPVRGRR